MNTVHVKDVGEISITQLKIGQYVKSRGGEYTLVYGFGHYDKERYASYLQIYFDNNNGQVLEISPKHLIFLDRNGLPIPIRSSDVKVGDILSGKIITTIQNIKRRGLYAPLTMSGDIVVSGIIASNYVDMLEEYQDMILYDQHFLGHIIFTPQRLFCTYVIDLCKDEVYVNGYGPLSYLIVQSTSIVTKSFKYWMKYFSTTE
jgi:Hint module